MFLFRSSFIVATLSVVLAFISHCSLVSASPLYAFNHAFNVDTPIPTASGSASVAASQPSPIVSVAAALEGSASPPSPEASPSPAAISESSTAPETPSDDKDTTEPQKSASGAFASKSATSMGITVLIGSIVAVVQVL